jgi:hypothetical protein
MTMDMERTHLNKCILSLTSNGIRISPENIPIKYYDNLMDQLQLPTKVYTAEYKMSYLNLILIFILVIYKTVRRKYKEMKILKPKFYQSISRTI